MGDDEFWEYIDLLGGKTWDRTLAKPAAALAKKSDETILRFAQAMAERWFQLDSPAFASIRLDDDGVQFWDANDSRWCRGAIIAGGRERFEAVRADPSAFSRNWLSDLSWAVGSIANDAWSKKHRKPVFIQTSSSMEPGANEATWAGVLGEIRTGEIPLSRVERDNFGLPDGFEADIDAMIARIADGVDAAGVVSSADVDQLVALVESGDIVSRVVGDGPDKNVPPSDEP